MINALKESNEKMSNIERLQKEGKEDEKRIERDVIDKQLAWHERKRVSQTSLR